MSLKDYVKLIKKKTETDILNRNNFIMLSAAAFAAARYEIPSMKNYQGEQLVTRRQRK
jgi:hypothetical protein